MTFPQAIKSGFNNYVKFDGRATRSEYWWWFLFQVLVLLIPNMMMQGEAARGQFGLGGILYLLIALALFLPSLGLSFRRLHDTNRSAWWLLIAFIPLIGGIVLLIFFVLPGTVGPNKYGVGDPLTQAAQVFE